MIARSRPIGGRRLRRLGSRTRRLRDCLRQVRMRAMSCQERGEKSGTSSLLDEKHGEETSFLGSRLHLFCRLPTDRCLRRNETIDLQFRPSRMRAAALAPTVREAHSWTEIDRIGVSQWLKIKNTRRKLTN